MPIAIADGIPLYPSAPDPTAPVDVHFDWTTSSNPLPIRPIFQERRSWCWAACVAMVLAYYEVPASQCSIVAANTEGDDVCLNPGNFSDVSCLAGDMAGQWANWEFDAIDARVGTYDDPQFLRPAEIKDQIAKGQPIEVGIKWWQGGSHAILIKGWSDGGDHTIVWINDPLEGSFLGPGIQGGQGPLRYMELKQAYGWGYWKHSWSELKRKEPNQ